MNNASLKEQLSQIFINSADLVEYEQADGSKSKTLFVRIPFRSLAAFRKVAEKVVAQFEAKFNWPVVVIATRTIISKHGKNIFGVKAPLLYLQTIFPRANPSPCS